MFFIGNLTRDPEVGAVNSANGAISVCKFSVAVNRRKKDAQGNSVADYFNCTAWRGLADIVGKFARKGKKVAVCGEIHTRSYDKDGVKHYAFEIEADNVELLSPKDEPVDAPAPKDDKHYFTPVDDYGDMPF